MNSDNQNTEHPVERKRYIFFGFAIFLMQFIGIVALPLYIIGFLSIISSDKFLNSIRYIPMFFFFLSLSLVIAVYFGLIQGLHTWNLTYWGLFYVVTFGTIGIKDKELALRCLKYCVYAIFFADIFTNLLLLAGFDVPWSSLPPIRTGEKMARFTGVKGNTLYSGSISFMAYCFSLQEKDIKKIVKLLLIACTIFNLGLSGSFRYYIICAFVFGLYLFRLQKYRIILILGYIGSIVLVYFATKFTMFLNLSNYYRFMIWSHFIKEISKSPIIGHGLFNMHLSNSMDFSSYELLIDRGVTESCILLVGYCFGLPLLCLFIGSIIKTLIRYKSYEKYKVELGLFAGLTLDLFWGGSFDNTLSISLLILSWYCINENYFNTQPLISNAKP